MRTAAAVVIICLLQISSAFAQNLDAGAETAEEVSSVVVETPESELSAEVPATLGLQTTPDAPTTTEVTPAPSIQIEVEATPTVAPTTDAPTNLTVEASTTASQDAGNPQTTIYSSALVETFDPSAATSSGESLLDVASSTPLSDSENPVAVDSHALEEPDNPPAETGGRPTLDTAPPAVSQPPAVNELGVVASLSLEELEPKKEFVLGVVGTSIAAKQKPSWQKNDLEEKNKTKESLKVVDNVPQITTNPDTGTITISGVCASPYYAIMVYRRADDYDKDPASYVINRSYPCELGAYSYTLTDIPPSLQTGTYYLLIAEQDKGAWRPTSAVIPITITKQ